MARELKLDPAKEREAVRKALADITVLERVASELRSFADELEDRASDREREMYDHESRIRLIFQHLGTPLAEGQFDPEAVVKMLEAGNTGKDDTHRG